MLVTEIVPLILSFLLGMCVLYFTGYSKARRKNRALQESVLRLEDEKQKVLAKYVTEKEKNELPCRKQRGFVSAEIKNQWDSSPAEINKPLAVDRDKRDCPYDEKRQRFVNYFTLLDEFHRKNNAVFTLQFHPIMNRFLASNSVEDEIARNRASVEFDREVQALFNQLHEEQQKVNSETDSIRSFSSGTLDELLDKLESAVRKSTDDASEVLKYMATPELWADRSLALPLQKAEKSVQLVLTCRNAVRRRMKVELNEM
ncbi:MAG: hypothetical protein HYV06_07455 [Deltaproteobacteria bacterium]|nr:hypothetical protein [Deltaproteobacteria bacterium]